MQTSETREFSWTIGKLAADSASLLTLGGNQSVDISVHKGSVRVCFDSDCTTLDVHATDTISLRVTSGGVEVCAKSCETVSIPGVLGVHELVTDISNFNADTTSLLSIGGSPSVDISVLQKSIRSCISGRCKTLNVSANDKVRMRMTDVGLEVCGTVCETFPLPKVIDTIQMGSNISPNATVHDMEPRRLFFGFGDDECKDPGCEECPNFDDYGCTECNHPSYLSGSECECKPGFTRGSKDDECETISSACGILGVHVECENCHSDNRGWYHGCTSCENGFYLQPCGDACMA